MVQIGTPEELFDTPEHTFVGYFIGSPGMNVLPGVVDGSHVGVAGGRFELGRRYAPGAGSVEIGIRPEFVGVTDRAGAGGAGLPMEVRAVENIGRLQIVRGSIDGHDVDAVIEEGARGARGGLRRVRPRSAERLPRLAPGEGRGMNVVTER